eukprot:gene2527-biopygen2544
MTEVSSAPRHVAARRTRSHDEYSGARSHNEYTDVEPLTQRTFAYRTFTRKTHTASHNENTTSMLSGEPLLPQQGIPLGLGPRGSLRTQAPALTNPHT